MKRTAIIIGNEGTLRNPLPGVPVDMVNYRNFLRSDFGGAWEENEIISGNKWDIDSLHNEIFRNKIRGTEYFLIIFTGHGYAIKGDDTYFELQDGEDLGLKKLHGWLYGTRSLVIADSCRKYIRITESTRPQARVKSFSSGGTLIPRYVYRDLYDRNLGQLEPNHSTFAASAGLDECADDSDEGGVYTKALLEAAQNVVKYGKPGTYTVNYIHEKAVSILAKDPSVSQNPKIYTNSPKGITPPFVVKPRI